jgi:hypothetical protein
MEALQSLTIGVTWSEIILKLLLCLQSEKRAREETESTVEKLLQ